MVSVLKIQSPNILKTRNLSFKSNNKTEPMPQSAPLPKKKMGKTAKIILGSAAAAVLTGTGYLIGFKSGLNHAGKALNEMLSQLSKEI